MRLKDTFILFYALLLPFTSCSDNSFRQVEERVPVTFINVINKGDVMHMDASSRASGSTWSGGDKIGVYMVSDGTGTPTLPGLTNGNHLYQASDTKDEVSLYPVDVNAILYYPNNNSSVNFIAYYPYKESIKDSYPINVSGTQELSSIDLLYCARTKGYNKENSEASLTFKHKLSNICITVSAGTGTTAADMVNPKLVISGMPTTANFALASEALSNLEGTDATITPTKNSTISTSTKVVWDAILIPHITTGGSSFTFTFNNQTYTHTISSGLIFEKGKKYAYNLTLSSKGIEINDATITDWNTAPNNVTYGMPSNCYILKPGGYSVFIPVSRANEFARQLGENEDFKTSILWNDVYIPAPTVSGSGYKGYIKVTSGTSTTQGNAVVTLQNTSGKILWSWHIWITDYDPDNEATQWTPNAGSTNPRRTFMDRNLGAKANDLSISARGLHYQWGRKDPFYPNDNLSDLGLYSENAYGVSIATTIQNPDIFYYATNTGNWHNIENANLWNSASKTIYDPCPTGWRVPTVGSDSWTDRLNPWYGLLQKYYSNGSSVGYDWGTNAKWPAAGIRDPEYYEGSIRYEGNEGYYWTATGRGYDNYCLFFTSEDLEIQILPPSWAFSVRCVRDI